MRYTLRITVRFEWNGEKNGLNQKKHAGLDFGTASRVFDDPNVMLRRDRIVEGEQRWHAIGTVLPAVLLVVHVYKESLDDGEEIIRIISAREANQRERRIYVEQALE